MSIANITLLNDGICMTFENWLIFSEEIAKDRKKIADLSECALSWEKQLFSTIEKLNVVKEEVEQLNKIITNTITELFLEKSAHNTTQLANMQLQKDKEALQKELLALKNKQSKKRK